MNQPICQRCPEEHEELIHHSDRGGQYPAIRYAARMEGAGIDPSTLKWIDRYDKTRMHSAIGYLTPHEAEEAFCDSLTDAEKAA